MEEVLAKTHPHPRDSDIVFDAGPHVYTITPTPTTKYTSVTTWIHSHFSHFDAEAIITKMMQGRNWNASNKYWGKTRKQIKDMWALNGKEASEAGTAMHYNIECFHNMAVPAKDETGLSMQYGPNYATLLQHYRSQSPANLPRHDAATPEWQFFLQYVADHPTFVPYRTEWMVYHEELQLAGSIDMIYIDPADGQLLIYDWKRAKEIKQTDSFHAKALTPCINYLPDTNYWHYAIQLNTYKLILEQKYGQRVKELCLVVLHPDNENGSYRLYPVPDLTPEMDALTGQRRVQLGGRGGVTAATIHKI